jgi:RecB family exonuclease
MSNGHAKLSPSSSDRWLACPASIIRAPETEDEGSEYAHEGTAAHALAERCLNLNIDAHLAVFPPEHAAYDSADMRANVQVYLDYVRNQMTEGATLFVEQRLQIFGQFEVWGTADAVIVTADGVIKIIDLKFGKGILVEAEDNTQLLLYGVGGLSFDWLSPVPVHTVEAHIVQPRRSNYPSQSYPVADLATWVQENTHKVARAFNGTDEANPGLHCKWCPIKGTCRERADMNLKMASFDFAAADAVCPKHDEMREEELVKVFGAIPMIRGYLDDVEAEMAKRAHDHPVAGLKWIAGRAVRKVTNVVKAFLVLRGVGIEPMAEPKMFGITELEKQIKAKGLKVDDLIGDCIEKVRGPNVLVLESHKSPAVSPEQNAAEVFK